jgi:hypothetical protein
MLIKTLILTKLKLLSLILFLIAALYVHGSVNVYPVTVNSEYSPRNPFRGVENILLPNDEMTDNYYFTNDEIFDNGTTYKRIHHIPGSSPQFDAGLFWPYNSSLHTFSLDIIQKSSDTRWRSIQSLENGSLVYGGWVDLNAGLNSLSINPEGDFDRPVIGFLIEGTFKFRKFSHSFGSQSWGYEGDICGGSRTINLCFDFRNMCAKRYSWKTQSF